MSLELLCVLHLIYLSIHSIFMALFKTCDMPNCLHCAHCSSSHKCNGAQRLMSNPCSIASSCVHTVTSYLMCAAL